MKLLARDEDMRERFGGLTYEDVLAELSLKREVSRYLEIGVNSGNVFRRITADYAVGVDPSFCLTYDVTENKKSISLQRCTSDRYFKTTFDKEFDMIFVDGMHTFEYTLRDFYNAERICHDNSLIILHDCLPLNEEMVDRVMLRSYERGRGTPYQGMWTGDVWKLIPILQEYRPDLRLVCLDCPPTGLVCVTRLDPSSTTLSKNYTEIVDKYKLVPNTIESLEKMYSGIEIVSSAAVMHESDQTSYFRI